MKKYINMSSSDFGFYIQCKTQLTFQSVVGLVVLEMRDYSNASCRYLKSRNADKAEIITNVHFSGLKTLLEISGGNERQGLVFHVIFAEQTST